MVLDLSVVIPFYNEEENIRGLYERLTVVLNQLGLSYEIVFINDGSRDNTARILDKLFKGDKSLKIVELRKNFGQSAALQAGFKQAEGEIVIAMDGDLQHFPEDIPLFLEKMSEGYDIVSGWREDRKDAFLTRRLPSLVANWLMAKLSGVELRDFGTTFKAYRKEVIKNVNLYGELHRFIPALASNMGISVAEIPIKNITRQKGQSNYGLTRTIKVFLDLIMVKFYLSYSTRPLQIFGLIGLISVCLGFLIGLRLTIMKFIFDTPIWGEPSLFLSVLLIMVGFQLISIGLLAEMMVRTYHEALNKPVYAIKDVKSHSS